MNRRTFLTGSVATLALLAGAGTLLRLGRPAEALAETFEVTKTEAEWRAILDEAQYRGAARGGHRAPRHQPAQRRKAQGHLPLRRLRPAAYPSETKYESGTGWPSFWESLPNAVGTKEDTSLFDVRTEVHCRRCGGHFGHIFDDGPQPTGKRHCLNGVALTFRPATA